MSLFDEVPQRLKFRKTRDPFLAQGKVIQSVEGIWVLIDVGFREFSITGPPGKGMPCWRANLSSMLPMPMSRVSPRTLYFPCNFAMTCVLPPLRVELGHHSSHCCRPISICATQWLTPMRGTSNLLDNVLATDAPIRRQGPRPGPCEYAIAPMSAGVSC